jgi:hypothetical protein
VAAVRAGMDLKQVGAGGSVDIEDAEGDDGRDKFF